MNSDDNVTIEERHTKELTREEAREKRDYYLAIAERNTNLEEGPMEDIDSADSAMATLILPGG